LAGIDYWVLPDDFLIHQTHHYLEDTRAKEVNNEDSNNRMKANIILI
jgi:hypothetical protein